MEKQAVLETRNLLIRPFETADASDVQRLAGDKTVADTTLNIPHPYEDGMAEDFATVARQKYETGLSFESAIELKASKELKPPFVRHTAGKE